MNNRICINCIHKDVCYRYRLNYIGAREGTCTNYQKEEKKGEWIPIKTRPLTDEEKEEYPDYTFMYDCHMPEDGEEVLITTPYGVRVDTFYRDEGCYFENYCDEDEVLAWQPMPEAYKEEEEK